MLGKVSATSVVALVALVSPFAMAQSPSSSPYPSCSSGPSPAHHQASSLIPGLSRPSSSSPAGAITGRQMDLGTTVQTSIAGYPPFPDHHLQQKVCASPTGFVPQDFFLPPPGDHCRIGDYARQGRVVTFAVICPPPGKIITHGHVLLGPGSGFTGTTRTTLTTGGHAMIIITRYHAKMTGYCVYHAHQP